MQRPPFKFEDVSKEESDKGDELNHTIQPLWFYEFNVVLKKFKTYLHIT